ncbi:unnamed protein product [Arctogadus glacialis]
MKLGAAESSHTQLTVGTEWTRRLSLPPKLKHTAALAGRPTHTQTHTHTAPGEGEEKRHKEEKRRGGGGEGQEENTAEEDPAASMATYEPTFLPPNAEEQDFIQAYENVREKYKGQETIAGAAGTKVKPINTAGPSSSSNSLFTILDPALCCPNSIKLQSHY